MSNTNAILKKIEKFLNFLPVNDIPYGKKYFKERDFESLQLLIDSIINEEKRVALKNNNKYPKEDLENLIILKAEVDAYCAIVALADIINFNEDNIYY